MKKSVLCFCLASLVVSAAVVRGQYGTADPLPAATLLLPYFEVDLDDSMGVTTLFSVRNASDTPTIVNVCLWTDLGVRTLCFNHCLQGHAVAPFNLRHLLTKEIASNCGAQACDPHPSPRLASLKDAHRGRPAFAPLATACGGVNHEDSIARGYVTVDVVNECSTLAPGDAGYFEQGGAGMASNENAVWGDYFLVNDALDFAQGEALVHLQADASLSAAPTFYGSYSAGADNREPLASRWQVRFLSGFAPGELTRLVCWRDSGRRQEPFPCQAPLPAPFPMGHGGMSLFTEAGQSLPALLPVGSPVEGSDPIGILQQSPCPWASGTVEVSDMYFPLRGRRAGSLCLDFSHRDSDDLNVLSRQGYMLALFEAFDKFSVGVTAVQIDNLRTGESAYACLPDFE